MEEEKFKALAVWLIVNGKVEEALGRLAEHYRVDAPKVKVGLPKRHKSKTLGCYEAKSQTISVLNGEALSNPHVILHEFYHHLRTGLDAKHRGTERHAEDFARDYINAYRQATS